MNKKRVIFMGTPIFSVPVLEGIIENYDVILVVSQPDKRVGRKKELVNTPVKEIALKNNIEVFQPYNIKEDYNKIIELNPDLIITCAYGQIIPKEILDNPKYGCINVHASLLPKLRGGAPIHRSIMEDHDKTGITIMYMDEAMDTGDIISIKETDIEENDNLETLSNRLSIIGRELLLETLPSIIANTNERIKQDEKEATYAYNITREEEKIDFNKTSREVFNKIRALSPNPGAYAILDDKEIKIYSSVIGEDNTKGNPGIITNIYKEGIGVKTLDGEIILKSIKLPGKNRIDVKDYLNGINKEDLSKKEFK